MLIGLGYQRLSHRPSTINRFIMNTEQNLENARKAYAFFLQGDIDGILDLYADDVEFVFPGPAEIIPMAGSFRGKEQVRNFFRLVNENLDFDSFEPRDFIPHRDLVIILGHDTGRVRRTGKTFEEDWVHVATYCDDGKLIRWQAFVDTAKVVADFTPAQASVVA
jgi:uncharacterized protein